MLTAARPKELLRYEPEDGQFYRLRNVKGHGGELKTGSVAGRLDNHGYVRIGIDRRMYKAHRLAFLYQDGAFPVCEVDHANGLRDDNRWCNLRLASRPQNMANRPSTRTLPLPRGVQYNGKRFMAKLARRYLGTFDTPELAHEAWKRAAIDKYGQFARV